MNKKRPVRRSKYTLDQQLLEQYGLGSWLKKNAGWLAPVAALGSFAIPGVGPMAAAGIISASTSVGGAVSNAENIKEQQNAQNIATNKANKLGQATEQFNQQMQQNPQQINIPTFNVGGPLTVPKIEGAQRATADSVKNYQSILTEAIANKTRGLLNVDSILTANTNRSDFNRLKIPQYAQQIIDTSGDYALTPEEQKVALGTEYDKYIKATRNYRENRSDYSGVVNTKGVLEQNPDISQENFGIRNMLERMPWSKEEGTPYNYLKRKANGGLLQYNGQTHQGPDGGIPVDEEGNPSVQSGNKPVALTENKEVAWNSPNNGTYIFSEQLGFAKEAKRIMNRYKGRLGKEFDKEDKISLDTMNRELSKLQEQQEEVRNNEGMETDEYKKGGWLKSAINPKHKGYCTPMTKSTCTPRRKALARTLKKHHGFHKKEEGGYLTEEDEMLENGGGLEYYGILQDGGMLIPTFPEERDYYTNTRGTNSTASKTVNTKYTTKLAKGGSLPKYEEAGTLPTAGQPISFRDLYQAQTPEDYLTPSGKYDNYTAGEMGMEDWSTDAYLQNQPLPTTRTSANTPPQTYSGNPWLQVAGGAASILGNALMQRADRRNRPRPVRLQRYIPQNVDYSESRRQTKEMAELDKANMLRAMRNMGAGYMPNATNALTNADRAKYNAIAASMENEGNINTQIANQAAMSNAEIANREALINLQNRDAYNARQRQYLQNYGQTAANTIGAIAQERAYYDALNLNPYYQITQDPSSRWYWRRPRFTARNS